MTFPMHFCCRYSKQHTVIDAISDFTVKCELKNPQWNFCGIHRMSSQECAEEERKMTPSVHQSRDDQNASY